MSETRVWKFDSENSGGHPGFRSQDEDGEFVCLTCDTPAAEAIINSLETSLAEAQKERDNYKKVYDQQELLTRIFGPLDASETSVRDALIGAVQTAEQQLAEVKAQLDAQAGVIHAYAQHRPGCAIIETLPIGTAIASRTLRACNCGLVQALAYVREPETK